jgi:hypothetical protein
MVEEKGAQRPVTIQQRVPDLALRVAAGLWEDITSEAD